MIHYHGLPITPSVAAVAAVSSGHAFVSHRYPEQLGIAVEFAQSFAVDNGAFSAWKAGESVDWNAYYKWVDGLRNLPSFDFAIIPDVIDGTEKQNDRLLTEWPWQSARWLGSPVWHLHESTERLTRLASEWPRVSLGSSGEFASIGTERWWRRMSEAMSAVCVPGEAPICKLHGLRMLNPKVFTRLPFSSADSTNIARNIGIDVAWRGSYLPTSKQGRAVAMRSRIESFQSPHAWDGAEEEQFKLEMK